MSFEPRTRLQKILMGIAATPRTAIEHAVKYAVDNAEEKYDAAGKYDIAFTADITTDPTKPTVETEASFADALAAQKKGKILRAAINFGDGVEKYGSLISFDATAEAEEFVFSTVALINTKIYYVQIVWDTTNSSIIMAELTVAQ